MGSTAEWGFREGGKTFGREGVLGNMDVLVAFPTFGAVSPSGSLIWASFVGKKGDKECPFFHHLYQCSNSMGPLVVHFLRLTMCTQGFFALS